MYKQEFHDINQFPKDWGIVVFPVSMSRISNIQSPQECINYIDFLTDKIQINRVGANFIYSEGVYMNLEDNAFDSKNNLARTAASHMGGVRNLVRKNFRKFQIDHAFNFESWFQMYLSHKDFFGALKRVTDFYENDEKFRDLVAVDSEEQGKELTEQQFSFYLEEHTMGYLIMNREARLRNDFVNDREQWVLWAYPGKPPRGQIYLVQQDPLELNEDSNPYKGQYDLEEKKFIPYLEVDLDNY